MALRPSVADLAQLTDPAERDYVNGKRGLISDDQLLDDIHQYRILQAANRDEGRASIAPADESTVASVTAEEGPPLPSTSNVGSTTDVPTFDEFYQHVAPLNPGYSRDQIEGIYQEKFGEKPDYLPAFDEFLAETKPLNPDRSDEQIREVWWQHFGSKGALEETPGVLGTLAEGAKSTFRNLSAFGKTLVGDRAGVEQLGEEQGAAPRDPRLDRFLREVQKNKDEYGPDISFFEAGKAVAKAAVNDPTGAGLELISQIPNTAAVMGTAGAGALAGSAFGPLGTIAGGIAGLFASEIGIEGGAKAIEKSAGGFTPEERVEALQEGAIKGSITAGTDLATFLAGGWLMRTGARAMEAATVRTLEREGVDVTDRAALDAARRDPALTAKVREAQSAALQAVNTLPRRLGRGALELALESGGEGLGEYVGELAATGKADKVEAVLEAFAGFSQSAVELGLSSALSRKKQQDAIFGEAPSPGAVPIKNITSAPTVDDVIKQAGVAIGETPPVDPKALDQFIQGGQTPSGYSDAQHALDTASYQEVLGATRGAKQQSDGTWHIRGTKVSSRIIRPEELADTVPDGKTVTKSVYEGLNDVLKAQGRRLVVYESNRVYDGIVYRSKHPDTVFISEKSTIDPVIVAFHEAGHLMQGTPLYKAYQQVVISEFKKGAKGFAKERHGSHLKDIGLINEISADIYGDAMTDPLFMEKVFTRLREQVGEATATKEAQSFLDRLKTMIIRAKDFIRGKTFTTRHGERIALKYVKNLERVHDALATAVADLYYRQGKSQTSTVDNIDEDYAEEARRQGEDRLILPPDVVKEFERVGELQRGDPERAMVRVQDALGGGVLNPVVEHAGDLLHRMTHMASHGTALTPYVQEKTDRVLKYLTSPYGFEKEMAENIAGNAKYYQKSAAEWTQKVNEALAQYANEHAKLPVYNLPQWLAKHASIAIGRKQWKLAIERLKELKALADGDEFTTSAFKYTHDADRNLVPYERPLQVAFIGKTPSGGLRVGTDLEGRKYHILEERDGFKAGTKISGKELKERGYKPDVVDVISHEDDQTARDLQDAGIAEPSRRSGDDAGHTGKKGGGYVGGPPGIKNAQGLVKLRERLMQLTTEGEPGRFWYEKSGKAILDWAEGDLALAEKIIGLLAIYSPRQAVSPNTTFALRAYYQWASGDKISVVNTQGAASANRAQAWMDGTMNEREITGIKRSNFYINLMREVNPSAMPADVQGVTIDMWMARAMGYFKMTVSDQQYRFAEREIKRIASKLGWEPQQVQAAIWVAIKSRVEAVYPEVRERAQKNGWLTEHVYTGKEGKTSGGWKPKDAESRLKFERALLAAALKIPPTDVTNASYNYADALHERIAQISWEATPSRSTGILPGIHTASYGEQADYLDAIDKVFRDENGQDIIGKLVKLAGANTILGPGAWQGGSTPGAQTMTAIGTTRDGLQRVVVSPEGRKLANLYADIRGYAMYQEGVYWHFPIFDEAKKNSNGVEIDIGRPFTPEEMVSLYRDIMTWAGHDEWAPAFTENGARIVNFKDNNHLGFQETIKTALQTFPLDHTFRVFRVEGDARTNDWKEAPNGEQYRQRIRAAGGSDLLRAAEDLRKAVDRVNQAFSDKYGWGNTEAGGAELSGAVSRPYSQAGRAGVDLQGLPTPVNVDGRSVEFHGFKPAQDAARAYMEKAGLPYTPETVYHPLNKERAARIAAAYDALEHRPNDPEVKAAYRALIDEVTAQYREIEKTGLKVEFIKGEDPYGNPRHAILDIVEHNHFWVYSTKDGFGSSAFDPAAHPLLEETEIVIDGQRALANDLFRIVHDYFGHVKDGVGFRAEGEDNAWYSHMRMFSPEARRALTTETRGQNSWVNFGPFGEKNRKASPADTVYADQKAGLLPAWTEEVDEAPEFSAKEPPFGLSVDALPADAKAPNVNWEREQAQNWITNIPDDWRGTAWGAGRPVIYKSYIPNEVMPQVRASAEIGNEYDWKEFKKTGQYPPIVVVLHQNGSARKLEDGHHRVTYWREKGFDHFPAWVVDFRRSAKQKMRDEGPEFSARQTKSPEFKRWFGKSKVVNEDGTPKVVYHGTRSEFKAFHIPSYKGFNSTLFGSWPVTRYAAFFAQDPVLADEFARQGDKSFVGERMIPVYLRITTPLDLRRDISDQDLQKLVDAGLSEQYLTSINPYDAWEIFDSEQDGKTTVDAIRQAGFDGALIFERSEGDVQDTTSYVVFEPTQIKSATGNTGAFDPNEPDVMLSPAPPFVSQVIKTLDAKLPARASGQQIANMLKNTPGVKEEEILWMGLDDFLKSKEMFTKQEVLDFANANQVEIREVEKGGAPKTTTAYQLWNAAGQPYAEGNEDAARRWRAEGKEVHEVQVAYDRDRTPVNTKFAQYQLPGGTDYRELLLTLPRVSPSEIAQLKDGSWRAIRQNGEALFGQTRKEVEEQLGNARTIDDEFTSSHWSEPNVLAHVRFNTRIIGRHYSQNMTIGELLQFPQEEQNRLIAARKVGSVDWKKVLFLEEVQSDWHQKGRKSGYMTPASERGKFVPKQVYRNGQATDFYQIELVSHNGTNRTLFDGEARSLRGTQDQIERLQNPASTQNAYMAPDAPFKKTWHELALRRMLRYAAENGYDSLAWTTGEQQAERYDLSKQVEELHWSRHNGRYTIKAKVTGESDLTGIAYDIDESKLPDYVGKELAQKIVELKGKKWTGLFRGVDLKIGGEGMKGFYDQIIPAYLNKYGKKWGAKVGTITVPTDTDTHYVGPTYTLEELKAALPVLQGYRDVYISPFTKRRVDLTGPINNTSYTKQLKDIILNFEVNDQNDATFRQLVTAYGSHGMAEILGGTLETEYIDSPVHALPITDAMRDSVMEEGQPMFSARTIPAATYTVEQPGRLDKFVRILQDKNIDIKRMVEAITSAGGLVPDDLNPVLKEEMYQKRTQSRTEDFTNLELKPLLEIMRAGKISRDALDKYAHARHVIDDGLNAKLKAMNPTLPNNDALSGMTDQEARAILDSYTGAQADLMQQLMTRLTNMVNKTRDLMVSYGLETPKRIAQWREQYHSYVPLRRTPYEDEGHPTGTGRSVRGSTVRERVGSTADVSSILANIVQARDQIITRGEKMRPVVAMAGLLMLHPNKKLASLDKPAPIDITDPLTGITSTVPGDLATYKVPRIIRVNPLTGLATSYPDPTYKGRDNVVNFRIAGIDYAIVFNEQNDRAFEIAKAFRELDSGKLNGILAAVAPYTRYLASINTQYNPIFGIVNFIRDAQFAMLTLSSTPLAGKQAEIVKNALASLAGIYQDARDSRLGLPPSSATAQMWERFTHVGGPTGYRDLFLTASDRAHEIDRLLNPNSWKHIRSPQDFGRRVEETALFKLLSDYNLTMENAIRLGVFKAAVDMGISDLQAASYAKNITVNFNKRGQIGAQMGALYAFFNASVQGSARILETLFERRAEGRPYGLSAAGKKIITGGLLIGVLQTVALALGGFDDDEPPEFVKQKNLVFPVPGTEKGYLMMPMPLGFNLIPNIGRLAAESVIATAKGNPKAIFTKGYRLLESMAETFSPTGGAGDVVAELSPTVADPFVALKANKDWTGREIYKEDRSSLNPTPGHSRAKDRATVWAAAISKAINWATGGTDYTPGVLSPSPDAIDYLIQQATGGVGREVSKAAQVVQTAVSGEELPIHKIPLAGRFAGSASGSASIRDKFYDTIRSVNIAAEEIKGRALHHEEFSSALASHPEARFEKAAIQIERQLGELRKAKQLAIDRGASREAIRMRDQQMTAIMQRFNAAVEEARKSR